MTLMPQFRRFDIPGRPRNDGAVASETKRPLWQTFALILVNLLLIVLIVALILANWMPAIYRSAWFQARFGAGS